MRRHITRMIEYTILVILFIYGTLWLFSFKHYPVELGISFSPTYASYLNLDWREVYTAVLTDLKPEKIRLAASWTDIEQTPGRYTFDQTDYMLTQAEQHGSKVLLVVGQKVPRWPECYIPTWAKKLSREERIEKLLDYVEVTVNRYKNHPAVELWQVENEPYISFPFGDCTYFESDAVSREVELVRSLDPNKKIVITDSGELSLWQKTARSGDILGTTLYRKVGSPFGFLWSYDWLPGAFYKFRAWIWGKKPSTFFVAELQAEPWFIEGGPHTTDVNMQREIFSIQDFRNNINFTKKVGASRAYLWGVEWWYWMKKKQGVNEYWETAEELFKR